MPIITFAHITDVHYDPHYNHDGNEYCHKGKLGIQGRYGRPGSKCDSPLELLNQAFETLHGLDPHLIFWTGDSPRHDRDSTNPRTYADVQEALEKVTGLVFDAFGVGRVFPVIGNWDTKYSNQVSSCDYKALYNTWSLLWNTKQRSEIYDTFILGGFYSYNVPDSNLSIIGVNTIEWYKESTNEDCKVNNTQLEWLRRVLTFLREHGRKAIMIGHVPPLKEDGEKLWFENCYRAYSKIIGTFHDAIITQYFGHVNRDIAYSVVTDGIGYDFIPLNRETLYGSAPLAFEMIGTMFTGPSVVPYFYPSFRMGEITETNESLTLQSHRQYYAPIDRYSLSKPQQEYNPHNFTKDFFIETCSSKSFYLKSLEPIEWEYFLRLIKHEVDVNKTSELVEQYLDCSVSHWNTEINHVSFISLYMLLTFAVMLVFSICRRYRRPTIKI